MTTNFIANNQKTIQRDNNVDLIRFIGLSLIILAHIQPPNIILNLRTFDVPLMIFVSGMTHYKKSPSFSFEYISHRFKRLVFPVWIFLTIYFIPIILLKSVGIDLGLNFRHILGSYLLLDGIGYVWIIRVFLLIALLTPFLIEIKNSITFIALYSAFISLYLVLTFNDVGYNVDIIRDWLYYVVGYSFLFLLGVRIKNYSKKDVAIFMIVILFLFIVQSIVDLYQLKEVSPLLFHINDFKYPPTNIYILYGIMMCILVYAIIYYKKRSHLNTLICFISRNSIWIYLWHIPFVAISAKLDMVWWFRYIIVYLFAVIIYNIQLYAVKTIKSRKDISFLKYLQG